jgi:carboxyl-terminal processing protease
VTIHEKGIQPHAEVEISADDESKIRLQQSRSADEDPANDDDKPIPDVQLAAAEEILTGVLAARPTP